MNKQYIPIEPKSPIDCLNYVYDMYEDFDPYDAYLEGNSQENTYLDKECSKLCITRGNYRSVDSMYQLAKTYFPNLEFDTFMMDIFKTNNYKFFGCGDIEKITISTRIENEINTYERHGFGDTSFLRKFRNYIVNAEDFL